MASPSTPRATCVRYSWWRTLFWDKHRKTRNPKIFNTMKKARAFLDSKGIDESIVNEPDSYGNTILMYYCPYYHLTKALLERNADPNLANNDGCIPLHDICTEGYERSPDDFEEGDESAGRIHIAEKLIKHSTTAALSRRNALGFTPLMYAAHNDRICLAEFLLMFDDIPRTEKIDALELLGAKQLLYTPSCTYQGYNDYDVHSVHGLEPGFKRLQEAMELRYEKPNEPCLKQLTAQNKLYNNYVESRTMKELLKIRKNGRALRAEAYLIVQRLIPKEMMIKFDPGSHWSWWDYSSLKVAANLGRHGHWEESTDILNFLIGLRVESNRADAPQIVLQGIKSYLELLLDGAERRRFHHDVFSDIHRFLQIVGDIVDRREEPSPSRTDLYRSYQNILDTAVWIVLTLICLYPEDDVLEPLIQSLEKLTLCTYTQWAGPDIAENSETDQNNSTEAWKVDVPDECNISIVHAFIKSAVDHPALLLYQNKLHNLKHLFCRVITMDHANAVNTMHFDPRCYWCKDKTKPIVHLALDSWKIILDRYPKRGLTILLAVIPLLIRHGFSWDQTDCQSRTITSMLMPLVTSSQSKFSAYSKALELIESLKRCDLQELAARVIRNYHIPYRGIIPKHLNKIIEME